MRAAQIFLCFFSMAMQVMAQMQVHPVGAAATALKQLFGGGVTVSNISIDCDTALGSNQAVAFGEFYGTQSNIGLGRGILLSTGNALEAGGRNDSTNDVDTDFGFLTSYAPLSAICGQKTVDVCRVSFDIIPQCDTLSIRYVFASDEYMEFVNDIKNDVFAFFISGPGIVGTKNIAVVPQTGQPVSVKSIHCQSPNAAYYVCNEPSSFPASVACPSFVKCPATVSATSLSFDGFTVPMVAKSAVRPCMSYHVEIAIADASDGQLDSGVFLEAGGISCSAPPLAFSGKVSGSLSSTVIEGCRDALIILTIPAPMPTPLTYHFSVSGSAVAGLDYVAFPDSITFPAGVSSVFLPIYAIMDTVQEGIETIELSYKYQIPCSSQWATNSFQVEIHDSRQAFCTVPPAVCAGDTLTLRLCSESDCSYTWLPSPFLSLTSDYTARINAPITNASQMLHFPVMIATNDGNCVFHDTAHVTLYPLPKIGIVTDDVCLHHATTCKGLASDSIIAWKWLFDDGQTAVGKQVQHVFPSAGNKYILLEAKDIHLCTAQAAGNATVFPNPEADFIVSGDRCIKNKIECFNTSAGAVSQQWHPAGLTPVYQPEWRYIFAKQGIYPLTLYVTNQFGCRDSLTQSLDIHAFPDADIAPIRVCAHDSAVFRSISATPTNIFPNDHIATYDWATTLPQSLPPNPHKDTYRAVANVSNGTYSVRLAVTNNAGCMDSVVQTFSIYPAAPLPQPTDTTVCFGEAATLNANVSAPALYAAWANAPKVSEVFFQGKVYQTSPVIYPQIYYLQNITGEGCRSAWLPVHVFLFPQAQGEIIPKNPLINDGQGTIQFQWKGNMQPRFYKWTFDNGEISTEAMPTHYFAVRGIYPVELLITDENTCQTSYETMVTVRLPSQVVVPSAFSPNGDSRNDTYSIGTYLIESIHFSVFNRVGETIFSSQDPNFQWDGKAGGRDVPEGVYSFLMEATDVRGNNFYQSGTITLFR